MLTASDVLANATFGEGTGRIWMSGLTCGTTQQLSLFNCMLATPIGSVENMTSCTHADDAAVRCQGLATGYFLTHSDCFNINLWLKLNLLHEY